MKDKLHTSSQEQSLGIVYNPLSFKSQGTRTLSYIHVLLQ